MYKRRLYLIGKWRSVWRPGGRNVKELASYIRYTEEFLPVRRWKGIGGGSIQKVHGGVIGVLEAEM